jgi:hypothetical protein
VSNLAWIKAVLSGSARVSVRLLVERMVMIHDGLELGYVWGDTLQTETKPSACPLPNRPSEFTPDFARPVTTSRIINHCESIRGDLTLIHTSEFESLGVEGTQGTI